MKTAYPETGLEIAIVGLTGRFPHASDIDGFWQNLAAGKECVTRFTREQLLAAGWRAEQIDHHDFVPVKGVVPDVLQFDAEFFGYSAREAAMMDPQVRCFHQLAYHAIESAGYSPENLNNDPATSQQLVGVYAGAGNNPFWMGRHLGRISNSFAENYEVSSLNGREFLATRIAYKLNLRGPAVTVQTACSTSLVAVHHAVSGLLNGECDMALAGAVAVHTSDINGRPDVGGYQYQEGMILSPDGHCRAFDAKAAGTLPGDGMGLVVLKRLEDAQRDQDSIYAVIKGSAINNDGSNKIGYTAPSVEGQARVIRAAMQFAEVDADSISYVEAHGTGTPLGDPIEIEALRKVYGDLPAQSVRIGSVKTNIGHLDAAAGIAGLIKAVLAMRHQQIPPSLHYIEPNPKAAFDTSPFRVNEQLTEWQDADKPLRAAVSSFGIGGTNAHVIIEEYIDQARLETAALEHSAAAKDTKDTWHLLTWSAKTEAGLERWQTQFAHFVQQQPALNLADTAFTLQQGRTHHPYRRALLTQNREQLIAQLTGDAEPPLSGRTLDAQKSSKAEQAQRAVVFMFSGQGSQFIGMARGLYTDFPVFKAALDQCLQLAQPLMSVSLDSLLFDTNSDAEREALIQRTDITQPLLFMVEYAAAKLLMSLGVHPTAMVGHSLGEYVAACLADVLPLDAIFPLVIARGNVMASVETGAMLAVIQDERQLKALLTACDIQLDIAAVNSSQQCVLAGEAAQIERMESVLRERDIQSTRLNVSHGYHSYLMQPILAEFRAVVTDTLSRFSVNAPSIAYYSNSNGELITHEQVSNPDYWVQHLRGTVRFADALSNLMTDENALLIEVGPGRALTGFARQHSSKQPTHGLINALRHPKDAESDTQKLLTSIARAHVKGVNIDWHALAALHHSGELHHSGAKARAQRIALPGYAFTPTEFVPEPVEPLIANRAQGHNSQTDPQTESVALYQAQWSPVPLPMLSTETTEAPETTETKTTETASVAKTLIAFDDENSLVSSSLHAWCAQHDKPLIRVIRGEKFAQQSAGCYRLNPASTHDVALFIDELMRLEKFPDTIVHGWALDAAETRDDTQWLDDGFYGLVALVQALVEKLGNEAMQCLLASRQRCNVSGHEAVEPIKATLQGPLRVFSHEMANMKVRAIDFAALSLTSDATKKRQLQREAVQLQQEFALGLRADEQQIAYRGLQRWGLSYNALSQVHVDPRNNLSSEQSVIANPLISNEFKANGVYLITGGLGGIGLTLAEHFAANAVGKSITLVLTSRREFPSADQFDALLNSAETDAKTISTIRAIQRIQALGASVMAVAADVNARDALQQLKQTLQAEVGQVNGIVHAAGLPGGGALLRKQKADMQAVLAAKITGTQNLVNTFAATDVANSGVADNHTLDFVVLCSSITAILGGFGQIDYTAANAYLDAYAQHAFATSGTRVIAINWDNWQEVGMAAKDSPAQLSQAAQDFLGTAVTKAGYDIAYEQTYRVEAQWALAEHWILGVPTLPGTSYLNLVTMALQRAANIECFSFKEVAFLSPLALNEGEQATVTTQLRQHGQGFEFLIASEALEHAKGVVVVHDANEAHSAAAPKNVQAILAACDKQLIDNPEDIAHLGRIVATPDENTVATPDEDTVITPDEAAKADTDHTQLVQFGERWKNIEWIRLGDKEGVAQMQLPAAFSSDIHSATQNVPLHPALLDVATAFLRPFHQEGIFLPLSYAQMTVYRHLPARFYSHARLLESNANSNDNTVDDQKGVQSFDLSLFDDDGNLLVDVKQFTLREIDQASLTRSLSHKKVNAEPKNNALDALRGDGLTNAQALAAFDAIMQRDLSNVVVAYADVNQRIADYDNFLDNATSSQREKSARPELDVAYVKPKTAEEIKLADIWQEIMALETVGVHDDFFELGGDSLLLVQFHKTLQEAFATKIPMADLYELTTIKKLAAALSAPKKGEQKVDAVSKAVSRSEKQKMARANRRRGRR